MLSVRDNQLLDADDERLHHRTPTEPASSGSPVFDRKWELSAIHHASRTNMPRLNDKPGRIGPTRASAWIASSARSLCDAGLTVPGHLMLGCALDGRTSMNPIRF